MKRYICSIVTILTVAISIYAQSAEKIDGILESGKRTAGHASYLILTALDAIPDDADFELAFSKMQENRWLPKEVCRPGFIRVRDMPTAISGIFPSYREKRILICR